MSETNGEKETKVKLIHPLTLTDGTQLTELSIDVDELDMDALHNIELEYAALYPSAMPTNGIYITDTKYQALMLARVNKLPYDVLKRLKARDTLNVNMRMSRFLTIPS